jgi:hypothetical protein
MFQEIVLGIGTHVIPSGRACTVHNTAVFNISSSAYNARLGFLPLVRVLRALIGGNLVLGLSLPFLARDRLQYGRYRAFSVNSQS